MPNATWKAPQHKRHALYVAALKARGIHGVLGLVGLIVAQTPIASGVPGIRWAAERLNGMASETKMFIKIALSAAIVLGAAAMASAATKSNKIAVHRSGPPAQPTVPRTPRFSNPDSPAATGGGSLGYNQNIYNW